MSQENDTRVHLGDCLPVMRAMEDASVDLVYFDPPFFTQKVHRLQPRDRSREFSFQDQWATRNDYMEFLAPRLQEAQRLLSIHGSLFFHCDRNAVHLIRTLLDEVFGVERFRAEIIWSYRRWSSTTRSLLPGHQTILYYTKSEHYTFNQLWSDYSPSTNVDQLLQRRCRDESNKSVYQRDASGKLITNGRKSGVPLSDVWDIPFLNPKAKERAGYPTQKPLLLLERIITLATNEGDCVLDPFCGSGTTLVAACTMKRSAIGIDVSEDAIELTRSRIHSPVRTESRLLLAGRESYRLADEDLLGLLGGLEYVPVHRNGGIDAILKTGLDGTPVPIRVQRPWESVPEAAAKLFRTSVKKGARIMFLVTLPSEGCLGFAADLPPGVIAVQSPAKAIREYLIENSSGETLGAGALERTEKARAS